MVTNEFKARLQREIKAFALRDFITKIDGVFACPAGEDDESICCWHAVIEGPADSPYAKCIFELAVYVPEDFPFAPPEIRFINKVYYPNIHVASDSFFGMVLHQYSPKGLEPCSHHNERPAQCAGLSGRPEYS